MDDSQLACGSFVVSDSEVSGIHLLVEAALDLISQGIHETVKGNRLFAICHFGNDGRSAALFDIVADVIGVITTIRNKDFGLGQIGNDQDVIAPVVRDFAAGDLCADRYASSISDQMNLGREATF